ncbi:MAG TPA: hypothetical protein VIN61_02445 [Gammaproteobacteria bacterium]
MSFLVATIAAAGRHTASAPLARRPAAAAAWLLLAAPAFGAGAEAPAADIPRTADGKPDFSGIWESMSGADYDLEPHAGREDAPPGRGVVHGDFIPYQPWALEQRRKNFEARATADRTRLQCLTLGVPRSVYYPAPLQIFQRPRDLTIVNPFGAVRTIHTNGTSHPEGPFGFWLGDSRGHWEGDTLVVDVVDFNDETWLDRAGNFHSDALHVVERWTLLDANTIRYEATLEDSKVYTRPWTLSVILYRHREENFQLIENYCYTHAYDEHYPFEGADRLPPAESDVAREREVNEP